MIREDYLDAAAASLGCVVIDAAAVFSDWRLKLILNGSKTPRPLMANVATALRHAPEWKGSWVTIGSPDKRSCAGPRPGLRAGNIDRAWSTEVWRQPP
jgi:hypothetical protein